MYCTLSWAVPNALGPWKEFESYYATPILTGQKINATPTQLARARDRAFGEMVVLRLAMEVVGVLMMPWV